MGGILPSCHGFLRQKSFAGSAFKPITNLNQIIDISLSELYNYLNWSLSENLMGLFL